MLLDDRQFTWPNSFHLKELFNRSELADSTTVRDNCGAQILTYTRYLSELFAIRMI